MTNPIEVNYQVGRSVYAFRVSLTAATAKFFNTNTSLYEDFNAAHWTNYAITITEVGSTGYYRAFPPTASLSVPATEIIYEARDSGIGPQASDAPAIANSNSQGVNIATINGVLTTVGTDVQAAVDICNLALNHIGQKKITTLSDATEAARRCSLIFNNARDMVLRDAAWNFATVIDTLEELDDSITVTGWSYVYGYPDDALNVRKVYSDDSSNFDVPLLSLPTNFIVPTTNPRGQEFKIVYLPDSDQRAIVANINPAYVEYTVRMGNAGLYDPLFVKALSYKLAAELAPILNGSDSQVERMNGLYTVTISEAMRVNGNEDGVPQRRSSSFLDAR